MARFMARPWGAPKPGSHAITRLMAGGSLKSWLNHSRLSSNILRTASGYSEASRRRTGGIAYLPPPPAAGPCLGRPRPDRLALGNDGRGLDLEQVVLAHQPRDLHQRAGRTVGAEVLLPHRVHLLAILDVAQEDRHLADVGEGGAGGGQAALDVLVHLPGLGHHVGAPDHAPGPVGGPAAG